MVDPREARVELMTAALVVLVIGLFLLGALGSGLAMAAGGTVLLGSGIYQTSRGWHVALTTWVVGLLLFFGGIGVRMFIVTWLEVNFVAIGLVLIGLYLLWQAITKQRAR